MNKALIHTNIFAVLFVLILSTSVQAQGDPVSGAMLFRANCAACHGDQMEGGIGPALNTNEITTAEEAALQQKVVVGIEANGMPAFKDQLSEQEILDVVALLKNPSALASLGPPGLKIKEPEINTGDILPGILKSFVFIFIWTGVAMIALLAWIKNRR